MLPDGLYGKYVPTPESLFGHLFGSSWHGEDAKSALWLVHHLDVLLALCMLGVLAGLAFLWQRCRGMPQASQAQVDLESAALKRC